MAKRLMFLLLAVLSCTLVLAAPAFAATSAAVPRAVFPWTGFQMLLAGIIVVVLVGGGIALRRLSRSQKS